MKGLCRASCLKRNTGMKSLKSVNLHILDQWRWPQTLFYPKRKLNLFFCTYTTCRVCRRQGQARPPTHEMPLVASYKATAGISERIVDWTISAANWRRLIWEWADSNCDWKAFHPIVWTHCLRSIFKTFLYTSLVPTLSLMLAREGRLSFSGPRSDTKVAVAPVFSIHTNINTTRTLFNNICVQWNCTSSVDFLCCQCVQKYYQFKDITQFFFPLFY